MKAIKDLLSTYKEYAVSMHTKPYTYSIDKGQQVLYYFGASHSNDPADPQFIQLKDFWSEFLNKTEGKQRIALNEGGLRKPLDDEKEAIINDSEAGLITSLATKNNILIESPEPTRLIDIGVLAEKYTKDQIQYYYFARMVYQWNRMNINQSFEEYIDEFLKADKELNGWKDFDFSLENMKQIHKNLFGGEFDERDSEFFYNIIKPTYRTTVINCFSQDQGVNRDSFIVKEIVKFWEKGNNIFIVFGEAHAFIQGPALEALLKK